MNKLIIKNFGPIKDFSFLLNDYCVLVGPQASGKSTACKAIFYFKLLRDEFIKYIYEFLESSEFAPKLI